MMVVNLIRDDGTLKTFAEIERDVLRTVHLHCKGNISQMSRLLEVGRSTLYRKELGKKFEEWHRK